MLVVKHTEKGYLYKSDCGKHVCFKGKNAKFSEILVSKEHKDIEEIE